MTPPQLVSVFNRSSRISQDQARDMVIACGKQLARDVSPFYGLVPALELVAPGAKPSVPDAAPCYLLDDADAADALGYHDEDSSGIAYAKVFANPVLDNGGTVLHGSLSISCVLSHELLEMTGDAPANRWVDGPNGTDYAAELCMAADTLVVLAGGEQVPISVLAERGGFFDVQASEKHGVASARAGHARRTVRDAETVIVRLTDGTHFRCTSEHKVLLDNGLYVPAKSLRPGFELRGHVTPCSPLPDSIDRREVHPQPIGDLDSRLGGDVDLSHLSFGQLGAPAVLPASIPVAGQASLTGSIEHIGQMRTREKMIGIATRGIVTPVTYRKAVGDATVVPYIRESMREVDTSAVADLSVPHRVFRPRPQPTAISLRHSRPETILQRRGATIVGRPTGAHGVHGPMGALPLPMRSAHPASSKGSLTSRYRTLPFGHAKIVDTVERGGKVDVFDLTVPRLRNFAIGAGVFVHNCDAVEGDSYEIDGVSVSNFVLQAFFDPQASKGSRLDFLGRLTQPFSMSAGGYQITRTEPGKISQVFGESNVFAAHQGGVHVHFGPDFPAWRKQMKITKARLKRSARSW